MPTSVTGGLIILGGRDDCRSYPWRPAVDEPLRDCHARSVPVLAICLGHQIIADAFGGTLEFATPGEEGAYELSLLDEAQDDPLFSSVWGTSPLTVAESHHDVVTALPEGTVPLATTPEYPIQAFRLGSLVGVQFHPEVSPETMAAWTRGDGGDGDAMLAKIRAVDETVVAAGKQLAERFGQLVGD